MPKKKKTTKKKGAAKKGGAVAFRRFVKNDVSVKSNRRKRDDLERRVKRANKDLVAARKKAIKKWNKKNC